MWKCSFTQAGSALCMGVTNYSCGLRGNIGQPETLPIRSAAATMLTASSDDHIPVNKETGQAGGRASGLASLSARALPEK
jgi:hypothetical protein